MTAPPHRTIYASQVHAGREPLYYQSIGEVLPYTVIYDDVPAGATGFAQDALTVGEYAQAGTSAVDTTAKSITVALGTGTAENGDQQAVTLSAAYVKDSVANKNEVKWTIETKAASAW